jgi:hypothetical protein
MSKGRILGLLGALIIAIGVFLPVISYPTGSVTYISTAATESYVIFGLAALAVILALANKTKLIWISGVGAMGALVYTFFHVRQTIATVVTQQVDSLATVQGSAAGTASFQWGWGVLLLGAILLIAAGATADDYE